MAELMDFFTEQQCQKPHYIPRNEEGTPKRLIVIFSNIEPKVENHSIRYPKRTLKHEGSYRDVDYLYLKKNFINKFGKHVKFYPNMLEKEILDALAEDFPDPKLVDTLKKELEEEKKPEKVKEIEQTLDEITKRYEDLQFYDCFVFIFLTFCPENDSSKIFFHNSIVPLNTILEKVSNVPGMNGKPKIFLVQADDLKLMQEKTKTKGTTPFEIIQQKIPTDADRLIITSTIPAKCFVAGDDDPSFLIQAFVEAINENKSGLDLLSLTVDINDRVAKLIETSRKSKTAEELQKRRWDELQIPCVTSTLRKLLFL